MALAAVIKLVPTVGSKFCQPMSFLDLKSFKIHFWMNMALVTKQFMAITRCLMVDGLVEDWVTVFKRLLK